MLQESRQALYLKRIGFEGIPQVTLDDLARLQRLHVFAVPFENLDIHLGRPIDLSRSFDKVVIEQRGGFCYELNGLFYQLLISVGFHAEIISGRVYNKAKRVYPPEFDHMALLVHLDGGHYLVDAGNGEFAAGPLKIEYDVIQSDSRGLFKISRAAAPYLFVSKMINGEESPEYLFSVTPRRMDDFIPMLHFQQTSPDSHFTQKRLCTLPLPDGRVTLTGNTIKLRTGDVIVETLLDSEAAFHEALYRYFGIVI